MRSEIHNIYKYKEDIHSICDRAVRSDYNNKYNKCNEEVKVRIISSEHIYW